MNNKPNKTRHHIAARQRQLIAQTLPLGRHRCVDSFGTAPLGKPHWDAANLGW